MIIYESHQQCKLIRTVHVLSMCTLTSMCTAHAMNTNVPFFYSTVIFITYHLSLWIHNANRFDYYHSYPCRHVIKTEGSRALFKGLTLSLVGSMPTRAIYFTLYSNCKRFYTNFMTQNSNGVHFVSAMTAGLLTSTITSPIWVVKTQLQLDSRYHDTCNSWK